MIHPIIDELAKQYAGKLKCYKVNTDESASVATRYGIRSIPTVIIFKGGEKKDAVIGAVPKSTLTTSIEKFLQKWQVMNVSFFLKLSCVLYLLLHCLDSAASLRVQILVTQNKLTTAAVQLFGRICIYFPFSENASNLVYLSAESLC